mgnify:FL=1
MNSKQIKNMYLEAVKEGKYTLNDIPKEYLDKEMDNLHDETMKDN